jgi:hypothetical protein
MGFDGPYSFEDPRRSPWARGLLRAGLAILAIGAVCLIVGVMLGRDGDGLLLVAVASGLIGAGLGVVAVVAALLRGIAVEGAKVDGAAAGGGVAMAFAGLFGAAVSVAATISSSGFGFAPWGRPLRLRGALIEADLVPGTGWAAGPEPECAGLSDATRLALATLWHHDAQKEHSSVPAFGRLAWVLTGLGAPAELLAGCHRAALEEIEHARRCFALAGGYAGAPQSAAPVPEILRAGLAVEGDPLLTIALETLRDGCLIEDFNADVAERAAAAASDPAAKALAEIIARDERSHADLAWQILAWCGQRGGEPLRRAIAAEVAALPSAGPRAYADDEAPLVAAADPAALVAHGRVPADQWAPIYARRLALTRVRALALCEAPRVAA